MAPAQPGSGRYTALSNHDTAHAGKIYRLARHPVTSRHHPAPMAVADLRRVLATQLGGGQDPGAIHLPAYDDGTFKDEWADQRREPGAQTSVANAVDERPMDMAALARTVSGHAARAPRPQGSSGPVLAVSASASSTTAEQITGDGRRFCRSGQPATCCFGGHRDAAGLNRPARGHSRGKPRDAGDTSPATYHKRVHPDHLASVSELPGQVAAARATSLARRRRR